MGKGLKNFSKKSEFPKNPLRFWLKFGMKNAGHRLASTPIIDIGTIAFQSLKSYNLAE